VFDLQSDFELRGDQPRAIEQLTDGLARGDRAQHKKHGAATH
jgi:excinuclease UvrABC helicase subunit UvrB